jgi:hypothetical protein
MVGMEGAQADGTMTAKRLEPLDVCRKEIPRLR